MAQQTIDAVDTLNIGRVKINDNFTELYDRTDIGITASATALTSGDLDTAFPSAQNGFRVQALNMTPNPLIYTKVSMGWVSAVITIL